MDIKTSIKSDHSAIIDDLEKGPNFWKFNSNLVNDSAYFELLTTEYAYWFEEFKEVQDKRVLWDLIKYKIRQQTIRYSKTKARERRAKLQNLEKDLKECAEKCDSHPNTKNLEELECLQTEYDSMYDYITQGTIIRSRATWYEFGERNNKYFLNLENSNKKKSTVRKVFNREGKLTTDPKQIMNELEVFYSDLYDGSKCADMGSFSSFLSDLNEIPSLVEEKKNVCEGKLGHGECYNALQTFQKHKSPGNDDLTIEFYLVFWPVFGSLLVESLNYAFEYGELSNSQKQPVITLVEMKGKDKRQIKNWRPISWPSGWKMFSPK